MKIAVTATGQNMDSQLDLRFGRCANFIIVDTETDDFVVLPNENVSAAGGAGTSSAQLMAREGVQAVITGRVGPKALRALETAGIEIYTMEGGTVAEAVEKFKNGELNK